MKKIIYLFGLVLVIALLPQISEAQLRGVPDQYVATVKIKSPVTGSSVSVGQKINIIWTRPINYNAPITVTLDLAEVEIIVASSTKNSVSWIVPELGEGNYRISVRSAKDMKIIASTAINVKKIKPELSGLQIVKVNQEGDRLRSRITLQGSNFTSKTNEIQVVAINDGNPKCGSGQISETEVPATGSLNKINNYELSTIFFLNNDSSCKYGVRVKNELGESRLANIGFSYNGKIYATFPQVGLPSGFTITRDLLVGSKGKDVLNLQAFLQSKGLLKTFSAGTYDQNTKAAVARYQVSKGLSPADGKVGPETRSAINAEATNSTPVSTPPFLTVNLVVGSSGNDVVVLQNFLEAKGYLVVPPGSTKGYFGASTKSAVAAYQVSKGITPADGHVGNVTRLSINSDIKGTMTVPSNPAGGNLLTANLSLGSVGVEVVILQNFLEAKGFLVMPAGVPKGSFDELTRQAVRAYQASKNIAPVSGDIGPITRQVINNEIGGSGESPRLTVLPLINPVLPNKYSISTVDSVTVPLNGIRLRSEGGTANISTITVRLNTSGVQKPDIVLYLYNGSTLYDSKTGGDTVIFSGLNINVQPGGEIVLNIKASIPALQPASTISVDVIDVAMGAGAIATNVLPINGSVATFVQTTVEGIGKYQSAGTPKITVQNAGFRGQSSSISATFPLSVVAVGGNYKIKDTDLNFVFVNTATGQEYPVTPVFSRADKTVAEGSSASFIVSATKSGLPSGTYVAKIKNVLTTDGYQTFSTSVSTPLLSKSAVGLFTANVVDAFKIVFSLFTPF